MITYMAVLVQIIVGQFQFMECHHLLHPNCPSGRTVRMDVQPTGHVRFGLSGHHPFGVVVFIAGIVNGYDIHEEDVFGIAVQSGKRGSECRKHASVINRIKQIRIKYIKL